MEDIKMKRVLIVDDSKIAREMLKKVILSLGHEIVGEAIDGQDGVTKYKELNPDIIFSDIEMPIMDGFETLKKIMEYDKDAYIVMVSSVVNSQILKKISLSGAKNIIKKPFSSKQIELIFQALDRV